MSNLSGALNRSNRPAICPGGRTAVLARRGASNERYGKSFSPVPHPAGRLFDLAHARRGDHLLPHGKRKWRRLPKPSRPPCHPAIYSRDPSRCTFSSLPLHATGPRRPFPSAGEWIMDHRNNSDDDTGWMFDGVARNAQSTSGNATIPRPEGVRFTDLLSGLLPATRRYVLQQPPDQS